MILSFVGAGGKTSCILELARLYVKQGKKVLITTTTHMEDPKRMGVYGCIDEDFEGIREYLDKYGYVVAGNSANFPGKIKSLSKEVWNQAKEYADVVLVEADGAKRYPIKVPKQGEPVIPDECDRIVVVVGEIALHKPLKDVCFRFLEAQQLLEKQGIQVNEDTLLTEEVLEILLQEGYVKPLKSNYQNAKITVYRREIKQEVHGIYLAAGFSRRFGGNKLLSNLNGKQMYLHLLERLNRLKQKGKIQSLTVVTQYEEIFSYLSTLGIDVVENKESNLGISASLKLGLEEAKKKGKEDKEQYYLFSVADQPFLQQDTVEEFVAAFLKSKKGIGCLSYKGRTGNPVIFHEDYVPELRKLQGDRGGKKIVNSHPLDVFYYEVSNERELLDVDT